MTTALLPARRRPLLQHPATRVALPITAFAAILVVWEVVVDLLDVPPFLVPSPSAIGARFVEMQSFLWASTWVTLGETLLGFVLAILVAIPIAVLIASSKTVQAAIYPILLVINAVPKIAIAPLLVVWMGFGPFPKVVMVLLMSFFPIVISTATGLRSTPSELNELASSLSSTRARTFFKVRFPWALPQVFVGLKVGISLAVVGAVIGEFVGASEGLGYVIVQSGASSDTALAFGAIGLLGVMSVALFYGLVWLEKALVPWAEEGE